MSKKMYEFDGSMIIGAIDDDTGEAQFLKRNGLGLMTVATAEDAALAVARGDVSWMSAVHKFGRNPSVASGQTEVIWDGLSTGLTFPTTAAQLSITGGAADTAAGTGARTISVQGLDANWQLQSETVTMTGATPALTQKTYLRCFRAFVVTAGSGETNSGAIDIDHGSDLLARISAGVGQTLMAVYTVPGNKQGYLQNAYFNLTRGNAATATVANARLMFRNSGSAAPATTVKFYIGMHNQGTSFIEKAWTWMLNAGPKTDIWIEGDDPSADSDMAAGFDLLLESI